MRLVRVIVPVRFEGFAGKAHPREGNVPAALEQCARFGETFDMMETTFYVARETVIPRIPGRDIAPWRARLFALMSKNATSATDFFKIPTNRVVELGTQLVL